MRTPNEERDRQQRLKWARWNRRTTGGIQNPNGSGSASITIETERVLAMVHRYREEIRKSA